MASPIFNESVISENLIPSGIFVRLLGEIIEQQHEQGYRSVSNCITALHELRIVVLGALLLECPEPKIASSVDPRPTLCEAWYLSLNELISSFGSASQVPCSNTPIRAVLADTCCTCLLLLLYTSLQRNSNESPNNVGMSLDGPQTRAMLDYLQNYFLLGPDMFRAVALSLRYRLDIDIESIRVLSDAAAIPGVAILGACLFRAASGGLPPWAIEVIPSLYAALYVACGRDSTAFCQMLEASMDIRLSKTSPGFGAICPGQLLAGRYFESAKESSKVAFIEKSSELCRLNNADGWRRFKVLLKQACGGKKKSSLSLKPSFTIWDVERL